MQLDIQQITQDYGNGKVALKRLNLTLNTGIIGLLGPNGAGKSSLMRILAGISKPTSGKVCWKGQDIVKKPTLIRQHLGYLPQSFGVYENLSAVEFLHYLAGLKGLAQATAKARTQELLETLNLADVANRPMQSYSGGMKQRVGIAQALLNNPSLLIVDEPTVGLDPEERARFRNMLAEMAEQRIIILSTHIVSDVENVADQIAILKQGQLLAHDAPHNLLEYMREKVWQCTVSERQAQQLKQNHCVTQSIKQANSVMLRIASHQAPVEGAKPVVAQLEDAFLFHCHDNHHANSQIQPTVAA